MTKRIIVFIVLASFFFLKPTTLFAVDCLAINGASSQSDRDFCKNELANIESELAELLKEQEKQKKYTGTLAGDVNYLTSQINALKSKIKARSLAITQLKVSISEKNVKIEKLEDKIDKQYSSLAQLLRNTNEFDNENLTHLLLSNKSISEFYDDLESYDSIKEAIKDSVDEIKGVKNETEEEKQDLQEKQDKELDAKAELESAQKKTAQAEAEKKKLLSISKQREAEYKQLAAEKKAKADKIRSALFQLAGTSAKIDFGTALKYANEASSKTGIEPAFLLAILRQESGLGANVGKCYLTDISGPRAGYGINRATGKVWSNLMKPTRDLQPFLDITERLGLSALDTTVSCPIAGVAGYGGAMGPAQFIPSTWQLFEDKLRNILGYEANPWAPRDAFMASALYLTDLGAVGTSSSAQHRAACKYYGSGGSTCSYSRSVMKHKANIQNDIDLLSN